MKQQQPVRRVDHRGIPVVVPSQGTPSAVQLSPLMPRSPRRSDAPDEVRIYTPNRDKHSLMQAYDTYNNHSPVDVTRFFQRMPPQGGSSLLSPNQNNQPTDSLQDAPTEPLIPDTPTRASVSANTSPSVRRARPPPPARHLRPSKPFPISPKPHHHAAYLANNSPSVVSSLDVLMEKKKQQQQQIKSKTTPSPDEKEKEKDDFKVPAPPSKKTEDDSQKSPAAHIETTKKTTSPLKTDNSSRKPGNETNSRKRPASSDVDDRPTRRMAADQLAIFDKYYKIKECIGEGTFSTVYKAIDIRHKYYNNDTWESHLASTSNVNANDTPHEEKPTKTDQKNDDKEEEEDTHVAIKHIYGTTSPSRVATEISIMHQLSGSPCIAPMITAFRKASDVFIVMPFLQQTDFRTMLPKMSMEDIQCYMKCLFTALNELHKRNIVHRDVKPHNFLYDQRRRTGVLIDFGLAQQYNPNERSRPLLAPKENMLPKETALGWVKNDPRNGLHANRAGTKGFRAPEVLMGDRHQTGAIDIWSAGCILLTIMSSRYPFFSGGDDADSLIEMASVFGSDALQKAARTIGRDVHTNIPKLRKTPVNLKEICRDLNKERFEAWGALSDPAMDLVYKCLDMDSVSRISASDALNHPFFR